MFGNKKSSSELESEGFNDAYYDKHDDFYYTSLINSLILFTLTTNEPEKLSGPVFNPIAKLESEIDYTFTPVYFETIFRTEVIDKSFRNEFFSFKKKTDEIPVEILDWEFIGNQDSWIEIRKEANELLDKLGVSSTEYDDDYTNLNDNERNILLKGKILKLTLNNPIIGIAIEQSTKSDLVPRQFSSTVISNSRFNCKTRTII